MKGHVKCIKQQFAMFFFRNSKGINIWANDLKEAKSLMQEVYFPNRWDSKECIEVKWNWKKFKY